MLRQPVQHPLLGFLLSVAAHDSFAAASVFEHGDGACRTFSEFNPATLETCHPYLDPTKTYYLGDTEWFDNAGHLGFNPTAYIMSIFKNVMNPSCSANVESLMCHAMFKECKEVREGVFVPALLCRSECDARKAVWDECLSEIEKDAPARSTFETQMQEVVQTIALGSASVFGIVLPRGRNNELSPFRMLECDVPGGDPDQIANADSAVSWFHGQYPLHMLHADDNMTIAYAWPRNVDTRELYPEKTSKYTFSSGASVEVDCFIPEKNVDIAKIECPGKFVNPINPNHLKPCIKPCPVSAYSDFEYTVMWLSGGLIGLLGWKLNVFMALTWYVGGKRVFRAVPYQLKVCVFGALWYGLVETFPSLILKYELPCSCETEECTGDGFLCAINRSSIYILLLIQMHLCDLTRTLFNSITSVVRRDRKSVAAFCKVFSMTLPLLLMAVSYAIEGPSINSENHELNIARHAFSCSMRFEGMATEWGLLWIHFIWTGVLTVIFCMAAWWKIGLVSKKAKTSFSHNSKGKRIPMRQQNKEVEAARKRLFRISFMSGACLLMNTAATVSVSAVLGDWSRSADVWLTCSVSEEAFTRNWSNYGLHIDDSPTQICSQENAHGVIAPCLTGCFWDPATTLDDFNDLYLVCGISNVDVGYIQGEKGMCDCPCEDLVTVETPNEMSMALPYLSQATVVTIVGLNMGFREQNLKVWKNLFQRSRRSNLSKVHDVRQAGSERRGSYA